MMPRGDRRSFTLPYARLLVFLTGLALTASAQPVPPAPALAVGSLKAPAAPKKIVLIGGKKSHGPGMHDFPNGIPYLAALLRAAPAFAGADILTYPVGFPDDLGVLQNASAVVLYLDGVMEKPEPLLAPARIAALQKAMDAGAGLVALHQASTLPAGDRTVPLVEWLGAKRDGMFDRTTESATLRPVNPDHPVSAGVAAFTYSDEFYPTLIFARGSGRLTPILTANIAPTSGDAMAPNAAPPPRADYVVAWAFERPAGGRAFGFTGLHYLSALAMPPMRQLLVNAIAWSAHLEVPRGGIAIVEPVVPAASVVRHAEDRVIANPWGELRWYASAELGNSRTMTTGVARLKPGQSNPRHFHPNCDEVLHVISGRIRHTMNEVSVEMDAGDTVSIPQGVLHNATNIGTEDAVLSISFSTAYREAVGYDAK
ncbi:MAG: cupin domain-containing protein [Opitutae bacterium]|nr:cupin domain-containing protein [Opitutae bacterium]